MRCDKCNAVSFQNYTNRILHLTLCLPIAKLMKLRVWFNYRIAAECNEMMLVVK